MTNEEYRDKIKNLDKRLSSIEANMSEIRSQLNKCRKEEKRLMEERWTVDGEYAESVTGFKVGEVVKVSGYMSDPFQMIIDRMYVEAVDDEPRCLHVYGRRMTKAGVPGKNGTFDVEMIYNEGHKMIGDKIEHIN